MMMMMMVVVVVLDDDDDGEEGILWVVMERRKEACVWLRMAPIDVESNYPSIHPSISMMVSNFCFPNRKRLYNNDDDGAGDSGGGDDGDAEKKLPQFPHLHDPSIHQRWPPL
jgi:hypothetical protein